MFKTNLSSYNMQLKCGTLGSRALHPLHKLKQLHKLTTGTATKGDYIEGNISSSRSLSHKLLGAKKIF